MSGLCGWVGYRGAGGRETLSAMVDRLKRPAESDGPKRINYQHVEGETGLAIIASEDRCLSHFGENVSIVVYGRPHWAGPSVDRPTTPSALARVIADSFLEHGSGCLDYLHGPFALAAIDHRSDRLLLAVDRLGRHQLHYQTHGNAVLFSTRSRSLQVHPRASDEVDPQGVYDYARFFVVPSPNTVFFRERKLPPAHCLSVDGRSIRERVYWRPRYQEDAHAGYEELRAELPHVLDRVVARVVDGGEVGAFLSGGLDSSTICGVLARLGDEPQKAFSIGFDIEGYDETPYARLAARHFGLEHHVEFVTPRDVVEAIPIIAEAYDEPFGNESAVAVYYCAKAARESGVRALLGGDGGDEVFAGNPWYKKETILEAYRRVPGFLRAGFLEPLVLPISRAIGLGPFRKAASYIEQARTPIEDRLLAGRPSPADQLSDEFLESIDTSDATRLIREALERSETNHPLNRLLYADLKGVIADNDVPKVVRMCEVAGVEARFPMLDEEMVEYGARIPPQWKMKRSQLRYFFKDAMRDFLPEEILTKRKHGFGLPFGIWMRDDQRLRELSEESFRSLKSRGIFRPSYIDGLRRLHQTSHSSYYGVFLWQLMIFEQWLQRHLDRSRAVYSDPIVPELTAL